MLQQPSHTRCLSISTHVLLTTGIPSNTSLRSLVGIRRRGRCQMDRTIHTGVSTGSMHTTASGRILFQFINPFSFDGRRQSREHGFDGMSRERRRFKELYAVLIGQLLAFFVLHHSIMVQVRFIAAEHDIAFRRRPCLNVPHPANDVIKGRAIGNVVAQDEAVGAAKEIGRERTKALLARRVPQLQAHRGAFNLKNTK